MNHTEATQLVTLLSRGGLMQALEGQAPVWAIALEDVRSEDALTAAKDMLRERRGVDRWVTPGDVRDATRKLRERRLDQAMTTEIPPSSLDDDPRRAIAWIREYRHIIADGGTHDQADEHACHVLGVPTERHITGSRSMPSIDQVAKTPPTRDEPPARPVRAETEVPDRAAFLAEIEAQGLDTTAYDINDDDEEKTA